MTAHTIEVIDTEALTGTESEGDIRVRTMDEALAVLRGTSDGDALDPEDLALLQRIVNQGLVSLSAAGKARWAAVVRAVAANHYIKPFFHDIEHLTRDLEGYVFWRGVNIEHYSFRADRQGEKRAAHRLAAQCRLIESRGAEVNGLELFKVWEELADAGNLETPRVVVCWLFEESGVKLTTTVLKAKSPAGRVRELEGVIYDTTAAWSTHKDALRCSKVVTLEDYGNVVAALKQDYSLRERGSSRSSLSRFGTLSDLLARLENGWKPHLLPRAADVEREILGPFMSDGSGAPAPCPQPARQRG